MNIYKGIIILLTATLLVVVIVVLGLSYAIDIKPSLSSPEKRFARFSYEKAKIVERKSMELTNIKSPLEVVEGRSKDFPSEELSVMAPIARDEKNGDMGKEKNPTQKLSLVLIKDNTRLAIVNGNVVREGDVTKSGKIKKIMQGGIILKDGEGEKWLKIE